MKWSRFGCYWHAPSGVKIRMEVKLNVFVSVELRAWGLSYKGANEIVRAPFVRNNNNCVSTFDVTRRFLWNSHFEASVGMNHF